MHDEPQSDPEFTSETILDEPGSPYVLQSSLAGGTQHTESRYTGAFFPNAKHFNVTGGKFKSVTHIHQTAASDPPDFRVIPVGDLNLLHEIGRGGGSGVVRRRHGRAPLRRMYYVRIPGVQSGMTAAVYQGEGAEEQWREEISRYSELRHPYLFQIYGITSTGGLHAAVFHDDLIPHEDMLEKYRNSHFSTVFLWARMNTEFGDVQRYMAAFSGRCLFWTEYIVWIRPSAGRLCIDLTSPETLPATGLRPDGDFRSILSETSLLEPPEDWDIITSISLQDYHSICYFHLSKWRNFPIFTNLSLKLGSIRHFSGPEDENSFEIAFAPEYGVSDFGWTTKDRSIEHYWNSINDDAEGTSILENGWIRVNSANVADEYLRRIYSDVLHSWALAQANHIFNSLDIASNFENYIFVDGIGYRVELVGPIHNLPPGYLFLCPLANLETEVPACFRIPDCPVYWSLDPSGTERLSVEEAKNLGFPDIQLCIEVLGKSWDSSVYAGIRQFHEAKGFDPLSQEVAAELGGPLFQVSYERDALFAYVEGSVDDFYSVSDGMSGNEDFSKSGDKPCESANSAVEDSPRFGGLDEACMHDFSEYTAGPPNVDQFHSVYMANVEDPSGIRDLNPDMFIPCRSWKIVMVVQLILFVIHGVFLLVDFWRAS